MNNNANTMRMHANDANSEFRKKILSWFEEHGRHDLPWRKTTDPYRILVSEVMLQQTQVPRVIEKYQSFIRHFPSVRSLARARVADVLREWQGLGYNRRALALHRAAKIIVKQHSGKVPMSCEDLCALPGVGDYTARAVRTFAWNLPEVFIETNIRRVFIHHFFPQTMNVSDSSIEPFVRKCLWKKDPRMWYWALMDYGAITLKGTPNPNRKSASYARQSPFAGSHRQARSLILKGLLEGVDSSTLTRSIRREPLLARYHTSKAIQTILHELHDEGFPLPKRHRLIYDARV